MAAMSIFDRIKLAISILSVVLGIWVALLPAPEGLTPSAMYALGITIWAVGWWMTEIIPEYATGLLMCVFWVATKAVPFNKAFANFSTSGWWIMVGAFALGAVAGKTGLLKRISLWVLNMFPKSFMGQVLGLMGSGVVIGPLIPSMNAKGALSSPIALAISDMLGLERNSKGACGLFGACYVGFIIMGHMFLSGSFSHYVLVGMLPEGYQQVTWLQWFLWSLPWGIVTFIGMMLAIRFLYKPDHEVSLPKSFGAEQMAKLGPMKKDEKITLVVLILTLLMWMTESIHKISAGEVSLVSMCILASLKVMDRNDFKNGIEWPAVVFVGCLLNMGTVIQTLKVDKYLGVLLEPVLAPIVSEPALLIVVLCLAVFAVKFLIVSLTSAAAIFVLILPPVVISLGMHPWIIVMVAFAASNIFFLHYMNSIYLCSFFATKGEMVEHKSMSKLSLIYGVVTIIASLASIPYWRMLGMIQ